MDSKKVTKVLGLAGLSLCGLCCILPPVALLLGLGAVGTMTVYLERGAILILALFAVALLVYFLQKRRASSCRADCDCKDNNATEKTSS